MTGILFGQIFLGMIYMSLVMFQVDLAIKKGDWLIFFFILVVGISFGIIFTYCLSGTMATESLLKNAEDIYGISWYRQPIQYQKYVVIILMESQRPQRFHGFKIAYCNFEIYMKVRLTKINFDLLNYFVLQMFRTACSYYIFFKKFVE